MEAKKRVRSCCTRHIPLISLLGGHNEWHLQESLHSPSPQQQYRTPSTPSVYIRGIAGVGWYIWIISFDLFPLFLGGFAIEEDVLVSGIQFLRKFHFDPCISSKRDVTSSIEFK